MRDGSAGFTLVELLASLVVLSLLSLLLIVGLDSGRRMTARLADGAAAGEQVEGAQAALRERMERAFPSARFNALTPVVRFEGDAKTLEFVAPPAAAAGPGELRRWRLGLTAAGDVQLADASDLALDTEGYTHAAALLHGAQAIDIAYFGAAPPDNVAQWRARWREQPRPPRLVRVRVAFPERDPRRWPDLIVAPRATIDSSCVATDAGGCRGRS